MRYHSLIVEKETCRRNWRNTGETRDGVIMGLKHKTVSGLWTSVSSGVNINGRR